MHNTTSRNAPNATGRGENVPAGSVPSAPADSVAATVPCAPGAVSGNTVAEQLLALQDTAYGDFQSKLMPTVARDCVIGVRVPALRAFAKSFGATPESSAFLHDLPHRYYEENMLHALLICQIADVDACLEAVEEFLPFVDNWAVCDILSPKILARDKAKLLGKIRGWTASSAPYTRRFGMEMLMVHFLDEDFDAGYLEIPAAVRSDEYYVNMMIAWFFATALAKQWEAAIPYIEGRRLDAWTHRKTIQKARESFRITADQKAYLQTLR